jgi:Ca2+-binding RTX toxin-like protein
MLLASSEAFAVDKVVDGGAGTDSLIINYSGISSLGDFVISTSGDSTIFTDLNANTISFRLISNLTVGSYAYTRVQTSNGMATDHNAYWNATEQALYLWDGSNLPSDIWKSGNSDMLPGLTSNMDVAVIGSAGGNSFNLNVDRSASALDPYSGNWTMDLKDGGDFLGSAKLKNGDSIDMGAGNDTVYVMLTGANGTPAVGNANITKLDGGAGTDTLSFSESTVVAGSTLSLTTANATNFENLIGGDTGGTLNGDDNANTIKGGRGTDTINGNGGNDILVANGNDLAGADADTSTDDKLYGGAGNDTLNGNAGDNILDGGTGADTIYSGDGSDTIVIRSGDGGSSIADADVITDFSDTNDIIGLSGLNYSDLTVSQGTGSYSSHVVVQETSTSDFLLIIQNQSISNIDDNNFSAI